MGRRVGRGGGEEACGGALLEGVVDELGAKRNLGAPGHGRDMSWSSLSAHTMAVPFQTSWSSTPFCVQKVERWGDCGLLLPSCFPEENKHQPSVGPSPACRLILDSRVGRASHDASS